MGLAGKIMQAGWTGLQAGYIAARRVFDDPANEYRTQTFQQQLAEYDLLWSYYNSSMFDKTARIVNSSLFRSYGLLNNWQAYKSRYNLYRNIRLIYNPTRRLVDFYAGIIYPGVLSEDGCGLPDSVSLAIPFSEDTDPALKDAIAQFWQWSNWQSLKSVQVRYGAALGSVLVEIVDDLEHKKITSEIVWPGFVNDLVLDAAGNVKSYAIQYSAQDENGYYLYRKEVDQRSFRYYRDGEPYDYGNGAVSDNPYSFVPAVWIKHQDNGGTHGSPAIAGSMGKIDELNNLVSHIHDQIHKVIGAPLVMWSNGSIQNLFNNKKRDTTTDFEPPAQEQENVLLLKGPENGRVETLAGNLSLSDSIQYVDKLIAEIEQDHPELALYRELRSMSQVTGPAAARLVGDVANRVLEAQASYDQANMSLFRMAVAMAGFRANSGAWGPLNRQQQKFAPFDLSSYERGDLDMSIMPRPLLTPTKQEMAQEKQAMWQGVSYGTQAGAPLEFVLKDYGCTDEELAELDAAQQQKAEQIKRDQMLAQEDTTPEVEQ